MNGQGTDLAAFVALCHDSPLAFVVKWVGDETRWWQEGALVELGERIRAGERHHKILIRTCHGAGKTRFSAWLFLWWMMTRPGSRGLTTAPTWFAVENLLWREIKACYDRIPAELKDPSWRMLQTSFELGPKWVGYGLSSDHPARMEGTHSESAAARIVDEAKAVPASVMRSTQGMLDAPETLDVAISTPWLTSGWFYELDTSPRVDLLRVVVTLKDMIRHGVPGSEHSWRELALACGGEATPEFRARAMAEYIEDEGGLGQVNPAALDDCMALPSPQAGPWRVGVDVAFSTDGDESVVTVAGPEGVKLQHALRVRDTVQIASLAVRLANEYGAKDISVDALGVGAGPVSDIKAWGWRGTVHEFVASSSPSDKSRFADRSSEAAWEFAQRVNARTMALPLDPILRSQCLQIRFRPVAAGKLKLEKAPDGARSPDRFDSAVMATCSPRYTDGRGLLEFMRRNSEEKREVA